MFQILLSWILKLPNGNRTFATAILQILAAVLVLLAMGVGLMPYDQSSVSVAVFAVIDGFKAIYHRAAIDRQTNVNVIEAAPVPQPAMVQEPVVAGKEYPK